jgi:hypothetical protein
LVSISCQNAKQYSVGKLFTLDRRSTELSVSDPPFLD